MVGLVLFSVSSGLPTRSPAMFVVQSAVSGRVDRGVHGEDWMNDLERGRR